MESLTYTLLSDGSSDRALLPILTWLLEQALPHTAIQRQWADLREQRQSTTTLEEKIPLCLSAYPCDLLFIHRDAENQPSDRRVQEIKQAVDKAAQQTQSIPPVVCVIPIRMQEAWLLIDEGAIRHAVGNKNGKMVLALPAIKRLEDLSDPKHTLHKLLEEASGLKGRRLKNFKADEKAITIAEFMTDFTPLRQLSAFSRVEEQLQEVLEANGWAD